MPEKWINPKYAEALAEFGPIITLGNCSNCQGVGAHIYKDPKTGKMKSIKCMACKGTGQA